MDVIRRMEPLILLVVVIGALNWGMVGLFDTNVVTEIFGSGTVTDVIYVVVGICGLLTIPLMLDGFRGVHHETRPHRT